MEAMLSYIDPTCTLGIKMKEGKKKKEMKHTVSLMSYLKNKTQSYVCMDV